MEEFAATADLVKLSAADAAVLYGPDPPGGVARTLASAAAAGARLLDAGAAAVVVTLGARGALVLDGSATVTVEAPAVRAVDATGAGDAAMAALVHGLLVRGRAPTDSREWVDLVTFATAVAAMVCEAPGGATAMPTLAAVRDRFPDAPAMSVPPG